MNEPSNRRRHRQSRYDRALERREAQKRADQRFYNAIFGVIGACVLVVLGLALIASSGNAPTVVGTGGSAAEPAIGSMTWIELIGLAVVAIIAVFMWRRITKR